MRQPVLASAGIHPFSRAYQGRSDQVRLVRADLRELIDDCPIADEVLLCASELAANAVLHSDSRMPGGQFTVRVEVHHGDYVWIEIVDNGGRWTDPARDPSGSHGLDIIRALAADTGIDGDSTRRIVWARLDWPTPASHLPATVSPPQL